MSDDRPSDQPGADRDPVEAALAAAAADPVHIGAERLSTLEARVMDAVIDGAPPVTSARRRNRGVSLLSAAAVVLVVALGALTIVLLAGDDDALAIAAADRVVVELPDGESVAGEAGTELPDGARLEVIGFVEIDGRRFGPGSYRIVDGEVVRSGPEQDEPAGTADRSDGSGDDASVRTTVAGDERSDDESDAPGPDDGRNGNGGERDDGPVEDLAPRPADPPGTTAPARSPEVTRPPAPTTAPVRRTTEPVRPATTVDSGRPATSTTTTTTTTTTTSTTTSTSTSTTTTVPARTTVVDGDGRRRAGGP